MHVSHLCLLVAGVCVYFANPLVAAVAAPGPTLAMHPSVTDAHNEPTCIEPGVKSASSNNDLGIFASDCVAAATNFFNAGIVSRMAWRFARNRPGQMPLPDSLPLPFWVASLECMLRLDVLSDPDAEDRLALVDLAADFGAIMNKCVRPHPSLPASGFVPVGPRKVLKLSISPTPMDILLESESILNGTGLSNLNGTRLQS